MVVREITTVTIIEGEVQVLLPDADLAAEAEARIGIGTGVGAAVPDAGIRTEDVHPRELHLRPLSAAVGLIHVRRRLVTSGGPGHIPLLPGEILEATVPCHHLQGGVHHLLPVVIAAARLVATAGHVLLPSHRRGLLQENGVDLLPLVLRCHCQ